MMEKEQKEDLQTLLINPKLHNKQKEVLRLLFDSNSEVTEVLFGGGAGGGKSFVGSLWILVSCLKYPGTRWLIGRNKLGLLKQTTLNTFFDVCKLCGIKEGEHYKYNQQTNLIKFKNESEIILKDLFTFPSDANFDSLGSLEISGCFIDEANQISEKAKMVLTSRIRYKLDEYNLRPVILMTCNPAKNWVYNQYYKKKKDGVLEGYKEFIQALVTDNPSISKHYVQNLKRMDMISQKRLLFGEWEYEDELGLFKYDNVMQMFSDLFSTATKSTHYMSIDVARLGKDKTCIMVWNGLNVAEIVELEKQTLDIQAEKIEALKIKYDISNHYIAIDCDGVGGGLVDMLPGSVSILNNSKPFDGENYQNLKTQLYFKLAELINADRISFAKISDDQALRLTQELQQIQRENADQDGKIQITNKEKIKQMIGRSPDLSDAMAFRMYFELRNKTWDYTIDVLEF